MSKSSHSKKERIIPIQVEGRDSVSASEKSAEPELEEMDILEQPFESFTLNPEEQEESRDNRIPVLPVCNAPEKIIIVYDSAEDEELVPFMLNNNVSCKPTDMLKQALEMFLHSKNAINKDHEYALIVLNSNSAKWLCNFTNNVGKITQTLKDVPSCPAEDVFDLNSVFDLICKKVVVLHEYIVGDTILTPPYTVRTILLYGRSYTVPKLIVSKEIEKLFDSPYFTVDVLMTHETPDDYNNCKKIFKVLKAIDKSGFAYFFSINRDTRSLFTAMGKLLAHPLQRPTQKLADYSIANKLTD